MGRIGVPRLSDFVNVLVETGARRLAANMVLEDDEHARRVMREIAHEICRQYGRSTLYVPADFLSLRE